VATFASTLRRPRSIVLIGLTVIVAVTCALLGSWQLRRLDERREINAVFERNRALPVADVSDLETSGEVEELLYRRVRATGTYMPDAEVAIVHRTRFAQTGSDLVTPLRLADGSVILIRRGWVPVEEATPPVSGSEPPSGEVSIEGVLVGSEPKRLFTPAIPEDAQDQFPRLDIERLAEQIDGEVLPVAVVATEPGEGVRAIELAPFDDGPHLGYALQWFAFALIALIVCGLLLRRSAKLSSR
jgi:surfeit locus 1 family protein